MTNQRLVHDHAYPLACRIVAAAARQQRAGEVLHFDAYYAMVAEALARFAEEAARMRRGMHPAWDGGIPCAYSRDRCPAHGDAGPAPANNDGDGPQDTQGVRRE